MLFLHFNDISFANQRIRNKKTFGQNNFPNICSNDTFVNKIGLPK